MDPHFQRALVLLEQSRHELAERELRQSLAAEPNSPMAHSLLGLCLAQREQFEEATREAKLAVSLAPDLAYSHYVLATILLDRNYLVEALSAINEAIRLEPEEANHFGVLAGIRINQRRWNDALAAADQGLRIDAEHNRCANLRAIALTKLGRQREAGATIEGALARDPENALTHANQGWTLLEQSNPEKACEHFQEALRLDPTLDWAREGIVEALKARHLLYRLMLRYFLWMAKLSNTAQWGVIIGLVILRRVLRSAAQQYPALAPFIAPILVVYFIFVLLTWLADPLFNLLLRLNRFGRLALSRDQTVASNWVGGSILAALLAAGAGLALGNTPLLLVAGIFGLLIIPLAGTFQCAAGWPRTGMAAYTTLVGLAGLTAVGLLLGGPQYEQYVWVAAVPFFLGVFFSAWVANALAMTRPRR